MSQIATAYVLTVDRLASASQAAAKKDWKQFWSRLSSAGGLVTPPYDYSGSVLSVLLVYWEEHGVQLPLDVGELPFSAIFAGDLGLQVCAEYQSAKDALAALSDVRLDEHDLQEHYNAFTYDDWDEAGVAMKEAWQFVVRGLESVKSETDHYLLFVS